MIKIIITGDPVPQGRPRFSTRGGFPRAYDPPKSREYKARVARAAHIAYNAEPLTGALCVTMHIYRPIQKSGSKLLQQAKACGQVLPIVKPDVDNVYKAVSDAMTGIIWEDDNQITDVHLIKRYSDDPRVEVEVEIMGVSR